MMKRQCLLPILLVSFLTTNTYASSYLWVGSLSIGPVWNTGNGENQTFLVAPQTEKTYQADKSSNVLVDGELFLGFQKSFSHLIQGQLGLAYVATGNADLSGDIWDDADPQFNNHTYEYQVEHQHIALKGKLLFDGGNYWLIPWISASLGVAFNDAHGYSNTPTNFQTLPNSDFESQTITAFTYTLGVGVQKPLSKNWQIGAAYEFADWGKSELGRASGQTLNGGPSLDHLYTSGILFNLTCLF